MKRTAILIILAALTFAGCKHETSELATRTISGEQCYKVVFDTDEYPWGTDFYTKTDFTLEWPATGAVSAEAERELLLLCFMDSSATNFDEAARRWLARPFSYEDEYDCERKPVPSIDESEEYGNMHLESSCTQDSALAVFIVKTESFVVGAAHGMYSVDYLTIDKATGNAIHIADLVTDTNLLCEAVARAIQDLDVNKDTRECLFDEFRDAERMPMPGNFVIDSARNNITVVYSLYEITPYCCGIQSVVLPIFWLSKHVPLTPYAKRLFGPGSSLE
ncbi:MAG: DUF3298 domain-containing protein [Bacteroidales bacterium]|nr:DUF3298 domain-containing protein [Bacteroidales bacterium]